MEQATTGTGSWQSGVFDLLKFGIGKHFDTEQRETVIIREPSIQYEADSAGNVQQVGTTASGLGNVPGWAKWTAIGLAAALGGSMLFKAVK